MSSDIEFRQNHLLGTRLWKLQRVAWVLMAAVVTLALLGFFGGGGRYSQANAATGGLEVTYDRFARREGPIEYEVILRDAEEHPAVTMSDGLLDGMRIETIVPRPTAVARGMTDLVLKFERPPDGVLRVSIRGIAHALGPVSGVFGAGSSRVAVSQFIYP